MSDEKARYLVVAFVMAAVAATFLFRGEATGGGIVFYERETRSGCFWTVIGVYALGALAFVLRAIFS